MEKFLKKFERVIVIALLLMMALVVLLSAVELAVLIVEQMLLPPLLMLSMSKLLKIFSFFLIVLIGLELIEVIKVYLVDEQVHVEVIFLVAIIAIARKVIVVDVKELDPLRLIGTVALILALSGGYYLLKRGLNIKRTDAKMEQPEVRNQKSEGTRRRQDYRKQEIKSKTQETKNKIINCASEEETMNKKASWMVVLIVMSLSFIAATGCRSQVKQSGFLTDYPTFEKGPRGGADLVYLKPGVDFGTYDKIMMDQVVFYFSKDSNYKGINSDELNKLSDAFHKAMVKELQDAYPFVQESGPGVLRVRPALTGVKASKPVLNTISTVMPVGLALSIVKKGVTGTHMNVGEASMETEFLDSQNNDRVAVVIDKRSAAKYKVVKGMRKWGHAEDAFSFWAKRLRKFLDEAHGK